MIFIDFDANGNDIVISIANSITSCHNYVKSVMFIIIAQCRHIPSESTIGFMKNELVNVQLDSWAINASNTWTCNTAVQFISWFSFDLQSLTRHCDKTSVYTESKHWAVQWIKTLFTVLGGTEVAAGDGECGFFLQGNYSLIQHMKGWRTLNCTSAPVDSLLSDRFKSCYHKV